MSPNPYRTEVATRIKAKHRRDRRRSAGRCINGDAHGPATHGVLCAPCRVTHTKSA